jgi:glucosylceramidase
MVIIGVTINAQTVTWRSTTAQNPWVDKGSVPVTAWDNDQTLYISVNDATKYQVIDGWGGALNEDGWIAMSVLSKAARDSVMKSMFDTSGCGINLGRICMGANDYSASIYSCDDSPNDYTMANFSLAKDKVNVIPFALGAKAINPNMFFWASPHSPPAWMKTNNSLIDGSLKTDDATQKAYALYFQTWVQKMGAEGITISAVNIQNEPNVQGNGYPACIMPGSEMATLIKTYIGPQFKNSGLTTQIWLGTLQSALDGTSFYHEFIPPALGDAATNAFITGVSMQWNAIDSCGAVTQNYPSKKAWQTEQQCGNFWWETGFVTTAAPNDWNYGVFTVHRMFQWLRLGVNAYNQWNMVLDEIGMSNSTVHAWPQNSMISVNKTTKVVKYNPQFYAVKHFGYFVKPGAKRIATTGNYSTGGSNSLGVNIDPITPGTITDGDMMAFLNPNGAKVLVVRNSSASSKAVAIQIGTSKIKPTIPANSINTFLIANPVAVRNQGASLVKENDISMWVNSGRVKLTIQTQAGSASRLVSVSIIDASGKVVRALSAMSLTNDRLSIDWNGQNESGVKAVAGVYFARIAFGNETVVRKFALSQ